MAQELFGNAYGARVLDFVDLLADDHGVLLPDLLRSLGPVVEAAVVDVRVPVGAAKHVSTPAAKTCKRKERFTPKRASVVEALLSDRNMIHGKIIL